MSEGPPSVGDGRPAATPATRDALRAGRDPEPAPPLRLVAGPAAALLDGPDLRHVRAGGAELVQRVYVAVRDEAWNTIPGELRDVTVTRGEGTFRVTFSARHRHEAIDFSWQGTIDGAADGTIRYELDGICHGSFRYCKIGFNVHHALDGSVGRPYRAATGEGERRGVLPLAIDPQRVENGTLTGMFAPYEELAIEVVDGLEAIVDLEGDLLELQDHRNWIDGNFKSYATPLALGFPFTAQDGHRIRQVLTIRHRGTPPPMRADDPSLRIGTATGRPLPRMGLGTASHEHPLSERQAERLAALAPAHLRVDLTLRGDGWVPALDRAIGEARRLATALELAVFANDGSGDALAALAGRLASAGVPVARVLVYPLADGFSAFVTSTPAATVGAVRSALEPATGPVVVAGGTNQSFTDINRDRPADPVIGGLCFSASPTVHAVDDASIVENIVGLEEVVRFAREIGDGRSVHVSPITLATRFGPYPGGPAGPGDLPAPVDLRQASLLGAAWTAGAIGALAAGGAASATWYETTGWRGVMELDDGSPMPGRFPSVAGQVYPVFHVLADLAAWADGVVCDLAVGDRLRVTGVAVGLPDSVGLLAANVTPEPQRLRVAGLEGAAARVRILDEATAVHALTDPESFRADDGATVAIRDGELWLALAPYAVARVVVRR